MSQPKANLKTLGNGVYTNAFREGLALDPDLTVDQWADTYRILPSFAAESGHYRTDRTPYNREIMYHLSPCSPVERIVFMKSAQVGGTDVGLNFLGYIMHLAPSSILMIQPTDQDAESVSKERIDPMIEAIPELRARVAPTKEKNSKNTILYKNFLGGFLAMVGANAPTKLRSRGIRFIFADEVSAYKKSAGKEGDPLALVERRTTTYGRRKIFLNSTPTVKYECRIEEEYLKSDQRRFFVPCPFCNHMQYLQWGGPETKFGIKWEDGKADTAQYMCEKCTALIDESYKGMMLAGGEWRATSEGDKDTVGYHISALYSPPGWRTWSGMVKAFVTAREKRDPELLKVFVNTELGETWEEDYSVKVGADSLEARCEFYKPGTAPAGVLVVIASIDVQDNRFGISLYGYGLDEETWFISRTEVYGEPSKPEVWRQLDDVLNTPIEHELFGKIDVWAMGIDSGGHYTHEVYQFARARKGRVFALKGQSQRNKPAIGKPTKQDVNYRGQLMKSGVDLYPVGTDTVKSLIYGRLKINTPGPGFIHFHMEAGHDYFEQLTSEKQVSRRAGGKFERTWVKKRASQRNEALDEAVYSYAILQLLYSRYRRETVWQQLHQKLSKQITPATTSPDAQASKETLPATKNVNTIKRVKTNFVGSW